MKLAIGVFILSSTVLPGVVARASGDPLLSYSLICDPATSLCYQAFNEEISHVDAWSKCHELGMHLAMPRTQAEIDFIKNYITGSGNHASVWLGLTDVFVEMQWTWMDMTLADPILIPWKSREPLDSRGHDEDCVEMKYDGWNNAKCDNTQQYLCQSHRHECAVNSTYIFGDKCYHLIVGEFDFSATLCASLGGKLAMPKTADINQYLENINYGGSDVWIGLKGDTTEYVWLDGSTLTQAQSNFVNVLDPYFAKGVVMTTGGFWESIPSYNNVNASYVCTVQLSVDCGDVTIAHGVSITGNTSLGSNRTYSCSTGYVPSYAYTVCQGNQTWAPTPECLRDCGVRYVDYGYEISGQTTEGTVHAVTCSTGYVASQAYTVCQPDGTWSPTPVCLRDCGDYAFEDGDTISGQTTEGTNVSYTCTDGHVQEHPYTVCQSNGTWYPTPNCLRDCGDYALEDGDKISGQTTEGTNVSYTCTDGHVQEHPYTVCQSNGTWYPTPKCLRDCGDYVIPNGERITGNTTEGAMHAYSCSVGYIPSNPNTVCQSTGVWLPSPTCKFGGCPSVNVTNGASIAGTMQLGANIAVECSNNYLPQNNWTVCASNGTWSPSPACYLDPTLVCLCIPRTYSNLTLEEQAQYYIDVLTMRKNSLSKTRRQLSSAEDGRTSATYIGITGALVITSVLAVMFVPDMINMVSLLFNSRRV